MGHRIVKEVLSNNVERYIVQTNDGWFGIKKLFNIWTSETFEYKIYTFDAIFYTLEEAEKFCNDIYDIKNADIVDSEIIKYYDS